MSTRSQEEEVLNAEDNKDAFYNDPDVLDDANNHFEGNPEFDGPTTKRACTDIPALIVFLVGTTALLGLAIYILIVGDLQRLKYGFDFRAEVCGVDGREDMRFMYYPDPTNLDLPMCISACPYYFIRDYYCLYDTDYVSLTDRPCYDTVESTVLGFYCVPSEEAYRRSVLNYLYDTMQILKRSAGDLWMAWDILVISVSVSVVLGFVYLFLLKFPNLIYKLLVGSAGVAVALTGILPYLFWEERQRTYNLLCGSYGPVSPSWCYSSPVDFFFALVFISSAFCLFLTIRLLNNRPKLTIAAGILRITTKPLRVMKQLFWFPVFQLFVGGLFLAFLGFVICATMGTGSIETIYNPNTPDYYSKEIVFTISEKFMLMCNLFMTFWWLGVLAEMGRFVVSCAVAIWYFSRERSVLYSPIKRGMSYCVRYHLGSIALSALCKLVFTIPAFIIRPFRNFLKKTQNQRKSRIVRAVLLITAYERLMKFTTDLSVVHQAIFADQYWPCAKKSYFLIVRNHQRAGVPQKAVTFTLFYIKLSLMLAGLVTGYALLLFRNKTFTGQLTVQLTSFIGPMCFAGLGTWFVSEVFGGAFEVCCTTTLFSASADEEMNAREQRFADQDLQEFMDHLGKEQNAHEREAQNIKKARNAFDEIDSDEEPMFSKKSRNNKIVPLFEDKALSPEKPEPMTENIFVHRPNIPQPPRNPNIIASDSTWMSSQITSRPQSGITDEQEPDSSRPMFRKAKFV